METRTQLRAICPACFAQQAIRKNGRLVDHGYRRPQQWHQNVGTCSGAGETRFGTLAGRDYTTALAERLREQAKAFEYRANEVVAGRGEVLVNERVGFGVSMEVVKENPTQGDRERYASRLASSASQMRTSAKEFAALVVVWQAAEPVAVEVETKSAGPLVHLRGSYYDKNARACAASAMAAQQYRPVTDDASKATCSKCLARLAAKKGAA